MKKYRIEVDYGVQGYNKIGNIFIAIFEFFKNINSGAYIKITKIIK